MDKEYWTITEVIELFEVEEDFLSDLEDEDIICPVCRDDRPEKFFSAMELERLRVAKMLFHDMGVNLPGVDVILRMRQNMLEMRRQFDDILEDLVRDLKDRMKNSMF
jgi:MerR family transcriptional regulator, heat shock protein HspR